ncbi:MAG: hypothetical protein K0Q68_305 [Moraxellaceae bacterium]|jgi:hypothetical protein|nr:hypothetical protein [Moraxellaceae bacterium]
MDFDVTSTLWAGQDPAPFFHGLQIRHRVQKGGTCVSTGLSLLTREAPATIRRRINTQDPVSWSHYLQAHGMRLAYCPTDFRRLQHYVDDLLALDDLFTLSTYSPEMAQRIGAEPDDSGWICSSHFVILHRDVVYDTVYAEPVLLRDYDDLQRYVKRIFRVVPATHDRGL